MALQILIPTALRKFADNTDAIELEAATVSEVIEKLDERYPGFRSRLCEEDGNLRRFINIFVDGEDIRFLENLATSIPTGAEVSIVPAIAGGCCSERETGRGGEGEKGRKGEGEKGSGRTRAINELCFDSQQKSCRHLKSCSRSPVLPFSSSPPLSKRSES